MLSVVSIGILSPENDESFHKKWNFWQASQNDAVPPVVGAPKTMSDEIKLKEGQPVIRKGPYPELTWTAVFVGWIIGSVIALSIAYAALILGFSIEGSELAAILGWGVLRGAMRRTSILENNINQTIASAVNGASSGIMFSVPALFILSKTEGLETVADFDLRLILLVIFASITGCLIGLAFVIPLRKQMIDFQRLAYPGGMAVAAILKSPGAGIKKAVYLLVGVLIAGFVQILLINTLGDHADWHAGEQFHLPGMINISIYLSLMTVGVGYLSGRGGFWFGAGGFVCYFLLAPMMNSFGDPSVKELIHPEIRQQALDGKTFASMKSALGFVEEKKLDSDSKLAAVFTKAASAIEKRKSTVKPNTANTDDSKKDISEKTPILPVLLADPDLELLEEFKSELHTIAESVPAKDGSLKRKTEKKLKGFQNTSAIESLIWLKAEFPQLAENDRKALEAETNSKSLTELIEKLKAEGKLTPEFSKNLFAATHCHSLVYSSPGRLRGKLFKPTGIGMLIGAAIGGILAAFPLILSAFKSMHSASKNRGDGIELENDEMPIKWLYSAIAFGAIAMIFIAYQSVPEIELWRAATMAILGTLWVWVAGVIVAECIGRTNWSPLSGMTLIAVTILILIAGTGNVLPKPSVVVASIVVGAAVCLAISQASDMMLDLKSGYMVGAVPRKQQMAQYIGCWLGPCIVILLLIVLANQYELGSSDLPAPQASALATVIEGILKDNIPTYRYVAGGGLGLMLAVSGLGGIGVLVALGFYMPFNIVLTYTAGNLLRMGSDKVFGKSFAEEVGIPVCAGLIVGEALVNVGNAFVMIFAG